MKNHYTKLKIAGLMMLLALPVVVLAETVVRTGDSVSISESQTVKNDFYAWGGDVTNSGTIEEDLYALAGSVTINGPVGADVTVVGGTTQIHAAIGDDVRVIGGQVIIADEVEGDVFVVGGQLKVLSSASIGGDIYFYGGEVIVEGVVKGNIRGNAQSFVINSGVGSIDISALSLTLGDNAVVNGDISYRGVSEISRSAGAVVEGEVVHSVTAAPAESGSQGKLAFMLGWMVGAVGILYLVRPWLLTLFRSLRAEPVRVGLVGLGTFIILPILSFILIATIIGSWVGLILFLSSLLLFIVTLLILPVMLGAYIMGLLKHRDRVDYVSLGAGALTLFVLSLIPVLGPLLILIAYLLVLGGIAYALYRKGRNLV